jgi:hypothetical protein
MPHRRDPWKYLADNHPAVEVFIKPLDTFGETIWHDDGTVTINLAHDLGRPERRSTLVHEIQHIEVGSPCRSLCPTNERIVIERTARWLLPDLSPVARALRRHSVDEAAWTLMVMPGVILDRLDCLTPDELAEWDSLMGRSEPATPSLVSAAFAPERHTYRPPEHTCRKGTST